MLSIDPTSISERDNYKFLIGSIVPRPIAFVTTRSEKGILNGAPFSYFNIISSNPPMVSLSIQRSKGKQKDTARNILNNSECVVHIVSEQYVEKINKTAASLPPDESELELAGLTPTESVKISVPGVKEAKIRMECVIEQSLELGDVNSPGCDFFVGKIVQYHIDKIIYDQGNINPRELAAVSRLAGADYATIGDIFEIERPK